MKLSITNKAEVLKKINAATENVAKAIGRQPEIIGVKGSFRPDEKQLVATFTFDTGETIDVIYEYENELSFSETTLH
ncbi:MAG TPA: hypothetical protein VEY92_05685 [Pseudoxanthomonas sp.]|nr:hypothetical protein [Pseudoxanthomonas sp.]